jgi:probable rRNA maturation factor
MPRYQIDVTSTQRALRINRRQVVAVTRHTLAAEEASSAQLSIAIVDDREIARLNRAWLGHAGATDVISFSLDEGPAAPARSRRGGFRSNPARRSPRAAGQRVCGEIIISAETARRVAARFGCRPRDELLLYLVHGLLHLCGYDDQRARECQVMRKREAELLAHFDVYSQERA